jgi:pimeloyl-ACP methyl ester carboxylesterase
MLRWPCRVVWTALVVAPLALGQDKSKKDDGKAAPTDVPKNATLVTLETSDGVYLAATYWKAKTRRPEAGNPQKATLKENGVVVIPNLRTHTQREWYPLAEQMHEAGLAVVTFDFRGFGQSTTLGPNARKGKNTGTQIRSADVTKSAATIQGMLFDLDAVKQFLLKENNVGNLNVRQFGLVAAGDLATVVCFNWLLAREFSPNPDWATNGGDIAALCLVSPARRYNNFQAPSRFAEINEKLPILFITSAGKTAAFDTADRWSKQLKIPALGDDKKGSNKEDERRTRPGGWMKVAVKKTDKKAAANDLGVELLQDAEFKSTRDAVVGFMVNRLAFSKDAPYDGARDVDQSFRVVSGLDR